MRAAVAYESRTPDCCGGACGAAAVPARCGGVKWGQWGRAAGAPDHQHRARGASWLMSEFGGVAANAYTCWREAWACQGALGLRLVRWSRGADAGACRCWPASAGGGVANRRRMPRIAVTGLRLGTALKQVFILEFDTMRVCAYQIMRMQTHVTKKHASECCVQLGVLAYLI